jgi:hypothetical protein
LLRYNHFRTIIINYLDDVVGQEMGNGGQQGTDCPGMFSRDKSYAYIDKNVITTTMFSIAFVCQLNSRTACRATSL